MIIQKDKFNSLNQLDRIEYRQKQDRINATYGGLLSLTGFYSLICLLSLGYISILTSSLFGYQAAQLVFVKMTSYPGIIAFFYSFFFVYDISKRILRNKALKELNEEYFKVEAKNVRRKK